MEVVVRLIDHHHRLRSRRADRQQMLAAHHRAGRIVWRGHEYQLRLRSNRAEKPPIRKLQRHIRLHTAQVRGHHAHADLEHEEGRRGDQRLIVFLKKCRADEVDRLINAVGQ